MESHPIFAALREALAELYPKEQDAVVVVMDDGLDARQIAFSRRAQTNWHNILTEGSVEATWTHCSIPSAISISMITNFINKSMDIFNCN
jgi:hypothetical protein